MITSTNPGGAASVWSAATLNTSGLRGVSCPTTTLCVAVDDAGNVLTSINPTAGPSAWRIAHIEKTPDALPNAISCPSASLCVAVDNAGNAITSTNPTGGPAAWTSSRVSQGANLAVSCASTALCVAWGSGDAIASTNPTGGAGAWHSVKLSTGIGVSCPSISLCVAVDGAGSVATSSDPASAAGAWAVAPIDVFPCAIAGTPCISEQLYAHDGQGTRVIDGAPPGSGQVIGGVRLHGDSLTLTWTHDGAARTLELR